MNTEWNIQFTCYNEVFAAWFTAAFYFVNWFTCGQRENPTFTRVLSLQWEACPVQLTLNQSLPGAVLTLPEKTRQEYLQVLGIESYFPRKQLPGAPKSAAIEWAEESPSMEVEQPVQPEPVTVPESVPTKPESSAETKSPAPVLPASDSSKQIEAGEDKRETPAAECRLKLACIQVNSELAVINAMPHLGPEQLSAAHRHLLFNALKAAGIRTDDLAMEEKPFHWPMMHGQSSDNSRTAAAGALTAYLHQKFTDWQFKQLLVMGEHAIRHVYESEDGAEAAQSLEGHGWEPIYTRSLEEFLKNPATKRELWAVMRNFAN